MDLHLGLGMNHGLKIYCRFPNSHLTDLLLIQSVTMHNNFAPPPQQPAVTYDVSGVQPLRNATRNEILHFLGQMYNTLQGSTPPAAPPPLSTNPPLLPFPVPFSAASSSSAYSSLSSQLQLEERKESVESSTNEVSCLTTIVSKNPRRSPEEFDEEQQSTPEMKKIYEVLV